MRSEAMVFLASVEARKDGEPEWMPDVTEVARVRARMERRGVPQAIMRGIGSPDSVPPGETPWFWWGGALAWILLWPALIALRLTGGSLSRLPWWLPPLAAIVHMLILAWPVFLSQRASSRDQLRRRFAQVQTLAQMLALEPEEFEAWIGILFRLMGYQVADTPQAGDHGIDLEVSDEKLRRGLVQCKRYRGVVGEPTIRDLYGTLVHENAEYAWLVTTGTLSRQARQWAEGKPLELWDGQVLLAMAERYR